MTVAIAPRTLLGNSCNVVKAKKQAKHATKTVLTGRWTHEEKLLFLYGLSKFGKGKWKKIGAFLPTRSLVQIKSHGQKVMKRFEAGENVFAPLEENREYFECVVMRRFRNTSRKASASHESLHVPHLIDEGPPAKKIRVPPRQEPKKLHNMKSVIPRRRIEGPRMPMPTPAMLPRRPAFHATLGNGNLSFSFGGPHTPPPSTPPSLSPTNSFSQMCVSPDPYGQVDNAVGTAIAAAALCQLSTLGRTKKDAAMVSP